MAALYVGNLDAECTEALLFQKFSPAGNLLNIRLCKNSKTGRCLGYGFVNYASKTDAQFAMAALNYTLLQGKSLRLMWADKNVKNLPLNANIFVKNLDFKIDEKALHDIFANFGNILSLKLATKENGSSKGFAFIQYEEEKSADEAIKQVNEKMLFGKVVCVTKFVPRKKRMTELLQFQNVYIKNLDPDIKDKDLVEICKKYGDIISAKVMTDEEGKSKSFGFVCFKSAESAKEAIKELNGKNLNGRILFADRAKKKSERKKEIMENFKQRIQAVTIRGPEFNAFMLQVRKFGADERRGQEQPVRVGEFVSWPASIQPVKCDKDQNTAVTNKNYSPKSGVTIKWKAPKDDVGDIQVVARFVAGEEYWQLTESREIALSEFPVNLKNCGKAKSCILFSEKSASCHEDNCDYILTYSVLNSTSVEFVLGGSAKGDQSYLAVGFSETPEAEKMKMIACTRAKTVAEIKFFTFHGMEEGLMEHPMHLENKKMDLDGDRMWCSFVAPMVTPSEEGYGLDLSVPLYQVYMRGNTNYTKSANIPILPSKLLVSKKEIQVEKIKLQYHTMEKPKQNSGSDALTVFPVLLLLVVLLHLEHFKNTL